MRSVWAVLAGFIFIAVLAFGSFAIIQAMSPWAFDSNGATSNMVILLVLTVTSGVFGMIGCYIAARLAPSSPMKHAMILGVIGVIFTSISTAMAWSLYPAWFNILGVAVVLPLAWLGGRLRENELETSRPAMGSSALTA